MNRNHLTKTAAALLAATLICGNPVLAETASAQQTATASVANASQSRFPDVAADHWAMKHISKLSLLGIIKGNEKGQYMPEAPVTQEQVITMAVRMMGLEEQLKALPSSNVGLEVTDYAKPYVQMALEKGLINYHEENTLSGSAGWGQKEAAREWVAKLSIRAIGKQEEAAQLGSQEPAFTDSASISVWAKGYINEAVALKIVTGMEDGSFRPKDTVTRAQMAAFLSRAGKYTPDIESKTATGVVESVSADTIRLVDDYGSLSTYTLSAETVYYGLKDAAVPASSLAVENKVYLILSGGQVQYAEVLEEFAKVADSLEGTIQEVTTQASTVTLNLKTGTGVSVVELDEVKKLSILDPDGKGMKLSDLAEGVQVELKRSGSRAKYSTVIIQHIPLNKTAEGLIQSIDLSGGKLNVLEKETGTVQYPLSGSVTYINNGAEGDLGTLRAGDTIRYTIKNDWLTHMEMVAPYVEPSDAGSLVKIESDKSNLIITIRKSDTQYETYLLDAQATIEIPGMAYTSYKDLVPGDTVKVMLTEGDDPRATKIIVTNRSITTEYFSTIVNYAAATQYLTVQLADGSPGLYVLSDSTKIDLGGTAIALENAGTVLVPGRKVDITASSEKNVSEIKAVTGYEGVITRTDSTRNEITLMVGTRLQTFKLSTAVSIELASLIGAKLNDLAVGDTAKVVFEPNSEVVSKIMVHKTLMNRLTEKNDATRTLAFKSESGLSYTIGLPTSIKFYNQAQTEIAAGDLTSGGLYNLQYTGYTLERVISVPVTRGTVTAVDAASGKVTLSVMGAAGTTVTLGSNVKVKREGAISWTTGFGSLSAGDRVEIAKDATGANVIYIAAPLQKKVDRYDAATAALYVQIASTTDPKFHYLSGKVYVHKGSGTLLPSGLTSGDSVLLYVIDGKIIEIEKQ